MRCSKRPLPHFRATVRSAPVHPDVSPTGTAALSRLAASRPAITFGRWLAWIRFPVLTACSGCRAPMSGRAMCGSTRWSGCAGWRCSASSPLSHGAFRPRIRVPIWACLAVIGLAALLNVALRVQFSAYAVARTRPCRLAARLRHRRTGGAPLSSPAAWKIRSRSCCSAGLISATALPPRMTLHARHVRDALRDGAGVLSLPAAVGRRRAARTAGNLYGRRLALDPARDRLYRRLYVADHRGGAAASDALAATELVLAREQHLSQLDGLAAAAAHELGTPLATITVVAREIERALEPDSPLRRGHRSLLREQAQRCREILAKITELSGRRAVRSHAALRLDRGGGGAASQFRRRHRRRRFRRTAPPSRSVRAIRRSSMGSAIWSRTRSISPASASRSRPQWTDDEVEHHDQRRRAGLRAGDHGPHRRALCHQRAAGRRGTDDETPAFGLGLGFFIAKTLLERSGASSRSKTGRRRCAAPRSR